MSKFFYWMILSMVMLSCGRDIDLFIPRSNQSALGDVSRLKGRLAQDISSEISYIVQVPCAGNMYFEVDKDLVVEIPKGFVDLSQYPCTQGYFDFHVTVCDTKGEMLVAGIQTVSEERLLESRIEFNFQIRDGAEIVHLAHGKQIIVRVNDPDPRERMELFYANEENTEWIQADGNPDTWDNVANNEWILQDSQGIITGFGYEMFCDSLDWINVDVFTEIPLEQRTDVCLQLPDEFTNTNTLVFMVFDDYNSLVLLRGEADIKQFCESYGLTPIGFRVTFVVISEMGENAYLFAKKSSTITEHHFEELTPVYTPYNEIRNFISEL